MNEPGIYRGLAFDEYAKIDAVNSGILTGFHRGTPAHVRYELLHGGAEPTPSLELGWLTHLAILEPARFEAELVVPPKVDRRTKEGKAEWAQFTAAHPGALFVDRDTHATTQAMRDALLAHPSAGEFLRAARGLNEVSIVWQEKEPGILCKARVDRVATIGEWPVVGDIKTARSAARRPFERAIHEYGYHIQAAHYLAGLEALVPVPAGNPFRRFVFFVVESAPPHAVACYELDDSALTQAETDRQRYLRTWRECVESGEWPAYGNGIEMASLPAWAYRSWGAA